MTSAGTTHEKTAAPAAAAVLYVCAERGKLNTGLVAERAEEEGNAFAQEHGLTIVETVQDEYGEPDPCRRPGWQRVREPAESGAAAVVITRWSACLAPERSHDLRHCEGRWLRQRGVRVRYLWAPLAKSGGEAK
ncbi:hypothetical protein AB0K93_13300 [Streptomyces sp. NPDC052676]|uniref:hypothetical protein n=1 Tax=Streptomyces sp. NPDC052676 TaxID=3154953 RepID=UPI0034345C81